MIKKKSIIALAIVFVVLVIDQAIKIYIKTHFVLHESVEVTPWFYLVFTENNGMAYGMELFDKLALTTFRIVAVVFFTVLLCKFIRRDVIRWGLVITMSLIIAGAFGNIIDCVFYGRLFTDSYGHLAQWADPANGLEAYGTWFKGRVVDMFYFPLIHFDWPDWMPRTHEIMNIGNLSFRWPSWAPTSDRQFIFFSPIFNFADSAITVGVIVLLLFYPKSFSALLNTEEENDNDAEEAKE